MTNLEQERWSRVKGRLKAEVGEDIFSSWFARMDLEALEKDTARLSVPTRFLKTWIQSHYGDRVLRCWQAEERGVQRIDTHGAIGGDQDARWPSRASTSRPEPRASIAPRDANGVEIAHRTVAGRRRYRPRTRHRAARRSIRA